MGLAPLPKLRGRFPPGQRPMPWTFPPSLATHCTVRPLSLSVSTAGHLPHPGSRPPLLLLLLLPLSLLGCLQDTWICLFYTPCAPAMLFSPSPFLTLFPGFTAQVKAASYRKASVGAPVMVTSPPSDLLPHSSSVSGI